MRYSMVALSLASIAVAMALFGRAAAAPGEAAQAPAAEAVNSPLEPAEALKHFVLPEGLKIELVAAEPEVIDPVAIRFDEDGRMWVAEMRDYPDPPPPGEPGKSRIRVLEDRDGDGRYETATTFADQLLFATGILPWRGGVIATVSGKVIYLKDTDGDGRADQHEVWFTGFTEENPQLRVNHPRFGLDNYVYVNSGLRGGKAVDARVPGFEPLDLRNRDMRFDPRGKGAELVTGSGQFGMAFDDYGNRFIVSNRNPLIHVVIAERYLHRNPLATIPAVQGDVAASGDASHIYPLSEAWTTSIAHAGQFTAACGINIYRGNALPKEFYGNGFTCEPTGNLVHREIITPQGATFVGKPAYEGREFLATRDTWCRPVNLELGPDGALYVVDMYRAVIEHPQFMAQELKNRPENRWGDDRGRIYRVVPANWKRPTERPQLSKASTEDLVKLFEHDNAWWRETAARLIYERQDDDEKKMALAVYAKKLLSSAGVVRAIWFLEGKPWFNVSTLLRFLKSDDPRVREQSLAALELLSQREPRTYELTTSMLACTRDADARVRFQAVLSVGGFQGDDVANAIAEIAVRDVDDIWTCRAVQCALPEHMPTIAMRLIEAVQKSDEEPSANQLALLSEVSRMIGAGKNADAISRVLHLARLSTGKHSKVAALATFQALATGLRSSNSSFAALSKDGANSELASIVEKTFAEALTLAPNKDASAAERLAAIDVLRNVPYDQAAPVLTNLASSEPSQAIRLRAATVLAAATDPRCGPALVGLLAGQTPSIRNVLLDGLAARTDRVQVLFDAIEAGQLKPTELGPLRAQRLAKHRDPKIRARAERVLAAALPADRTKVLAEYEAALALKPDAVRGKEVFRKNCATCHKLGDVGVDVGPSIGYIPNKTPAQLLVDILTPSKAIDNNFVSYTVLTTEGVALTGLITAETANSLTMKLPEGKTVTLLRTEVDQLQSNGISLMPEGLEKNIPLQDMADVISFLKNWRYVAAKMSVRSESSNP